MSLAENPTALMPGRGRGKEEEEGEGEGDEYDDVNDDNDGDDESDDESECVVLRAYVTKINTHKVEQRRGQSKPNSTKTTNSVVPSHKQ